MARLLSIRVRLILLLLIPCLLYLGTSVYLSQVNKRNVDDLANSLYDTTDKSTSLILNADRDMYQALTAYQMIASGVNLNPDEKAKQLKAFKENIDQANSRVGQVEKLLQEKGMLQIAHEESKLTFAQNFANFHTFFDQWVKDASQVVDSPTLVKGALTDPKRGEAFEKGREGLNQVGEILDDYANLSISAKQEQTKQTMQVTIAGVVVLTLLVAGMGIFAIRRIMVTIRRIVKLTGQVAGGDLRIEPQRAYAKDELGLISKSVDTMIVKMKELLTVIAHNTEYVHSASYELNDSSRESAAAAEHVALNIQDMTQDTELQTRSSVETSRAVEEMAIGIQRVAENSGVMAEHSSLTSRHAEIGGELLAKLKQQMVSIMSSVDMLAQTVQSLTRKSDEIGKIASSITNFANQTNLLSLNASIEAARAGEHGKGFHVVANEIRKLASQSIESADGINSLIHETRLEIASVSGSMDATKQEASTGAEIMNDVNQSFHTIMQSVQQIVSQIHETSAITEQMSASSQQISATMEHSSNSSGQILLKCQGVAAATQEQLAMMQNIASAAEQLKSVVTTLNDSVAYFKIS